MGDILAIPFHSYEKTELDGFGTPKPIHTHGEMKKEEIRKGRKDEEEEK